jgi:sortase (surface protein transpeptidase)
MFLGFVTCGDYTASNERIIMNGELGRKLKEVLDAVRIHVFWSEV